MDYLEIMLSPIQERQRLVAQEAKALSGNNDLKTMVNLALVEFDEADLPAEKATHMRQGVIRLIELIDEVNNE